MDVPPTAVGRHFERPSRGASRPGDETPAHLAEGAMGVDHLDKTVGKCSCIFLGYGAADT